MTDFKSQFDQSVSVAPAARTTSVNGTGIDLANYGGNAFTFTPGTITDGTHTPKLQESDDNSSFADVAAADQVGTLAALASNVTQKVSYIGAKRYVREVVTVTGSPATGGVYTGSALLFNKRKQ